MPITVDAARVKRFFRTRRSRVRSEIGSVLRNLAEELGNRADPLVPVDTGALKSSKKIDGPHEDYTGIFVEVGYGDSSSPYAVIVHERVIGPSGRKVRHPVGQAKYLIKPWNEMRRDIQRDIRDAATKGLKR